MTNEELQKRIEKLEKEVHELKQKRNNVQRAEYIDKDLVVQGSVYATKIYKGVPSSRTQL